MFLLDTSALSELTKSRPNAGFLTWLSAQSMQNSFIGAPTIGELELGIRLLTPSKKRHVLEMWLQDLINEFDDRILSFDVAAARIWAGALAASRRRGMTLPATDSQIAAIASAHGLTVVTRNIRHFRPEDFGSLIVLNPWSAA